MKEAYKGSDIVRWLVIVADFIILNILLSSPQLGQHLSSAYFIIPTNNFVRTELLSFHWRVSVLVYHPH